jgi:hypothetical protein
MNAISWISVAIALGAVVGCLAHMKGRSFMLWSAYGTVLGVIALPHILLARDLSNDRRWSPVRYGLPSRGQNCPYCGMLVHDTALVCRHCRHTLDPHLGPSRPTPTAGEYTGAAFGRPVAEPRHPVNFEDRPAPVGGTSPAVAAESAPDQGQPAFSPVWTMSGITGTAVYSSIQDFGSGAVFAEAGGWPTTTDTINGHLYGRGSPDASGVTQNEHQSGGFATAQAPERNSSLADRYQTGSGPQPEAVESRSPGQSDTSRTSQPNRGEGAATTHRPLNSANAAVDEAFAAARNGWRADPGVGVRNEWGSPGRPKERYRGSTGRGRGTPAGPFVFATIAASIVVLVLFTPVLEFVPRAISFVSPSMPRDDRLAASDNVASQDPIGAGGERRRPFDQQTGGAANPPESSGQTESLPIVPEANPETGVAGSSEDRGSRSTESLAAERIEERRNGNIASPTELAGATPRERPEGSSSSESRTADVSDESGGDDAQARAFDDVVAGLKKMTKAAPDPTRDPPPASRQAAISATGNVVYEVQRKLKARGFDPGTIDGRFGPRTRKALQAYQRDADLPPTGEIDKAVLIDFGLI